MQWLAALPFKGGFVSIKNTAWKNANQLCFNGSDWLFLLSNMAI